MHVYHLVIMVHMHIGHGTKYQQKHHMSDDAYN